MSDTPRTDAVENGASYYTGVEIQQAWNLARQLEGELNHCRIKLAEAENSVAHWQRMYECAQNANALRAKALDE